MSEIPPTRMNQQIFKGKMKAAQGGHKLLKKKADALKVRNACLRFFYLYSMHDSFYCYCCLGEIPWLRQIHCRD